MPGAFTGNSVFLALGPGGYPGCLQAGTALISPVDLRILYDFCAGL